jgi:hypothetical protein
VAAFGVSNVKNFTEKLAQNSSTGKSQGARLSPLSSALGRGMTALQASSSWTPPPVISKPSALVASAVKQPTELTSQSAARSQAFVPVARAASKTKQQIDQELKELLEEHGNA